ncbi:beta-phosphoglucomutase [Lentilactobacillus sp. Marseille-Q4993]|uniref:beta-phosphoglucomutase n=1 Tax=Lentilactobacillus sp. Marseille-Q4993 TaxID=3039492 RepID=UPI0024BD34AA|nr:beta-phosphoglucomutase [Lentilactobacillus sp. Marseille-Q4993]
MNSFSKIKGWCFDLHGVIADSWLYHEMAWHQIADKVGVTWTADLAEQLKGRDRMDSLTTILASGQAENQFSDSEKQQLANEKNDLYLQMLERMNPSDILPGVADFLADLKRNEYKMIIASASQNAPLEIKKLQLESYFDQIVDVTKLKHNKPAPDVFQKAAEMLNLDVTECIGLDDGIVGVQSINAAGMYSVGVGDAKVLHEANQIIPSTSELTLERIKEQF